MATGSFHPVERIVIPVQGTDREYDAQLWAVEFAAALGLPVHAVHVANGEQRTPADTFAYIEKLAGKHGVGFTHTVLHDTDVVDALANELEGRDLVIIGTRKLSHHYHVGSVAMALVERAPCPVQIVRLE